MSAQRWLAVSAFASWVAAAACGGHGAAPAAGNADAEVAEVRGDGPGSGDTGAEARADAADATPDGRVEDGAGDADPCPLVVRAAHPQPVSVCPIEASLAPMAPRNDWRVQDYPENLGVVAVDDLRGTGVRGLVLSLRLADAADSPPQRKGELLLDLRYVPGVEVRAPLDLHGRTLTATIQVPAPLADGRNGVQVFVKDAKSRSLYGGWQNLQSCGPLAVTLALGPDGGADAAYTDPGFDAAAIRIVGVKIGLGDTSNVSYMGPLQLLDFEITPAPDLAPEPALPAASPRPSLIGRGLESRDGGVTVDGQAAYVVGGNWRVIEYGQAFGATKWFPLGNGVSKHPGYVRCALDRFRRAGVQWLRVGLLDDGRAALDAASRPLDDLSIFDGDVDTFLGLADEAGIAVELTLADFLIAAPAQTIDGVIVQGRRAVVDDPAVRTAFMSSFLEPLLARNPHHPSLVAVDCLNEPEWLVATAEGGGWDDVDGGAEKATSAIPLATVGAFVDACAAVVRARLPRGLVTLGASASKPALHATPNLSYSAIHHYAYMGPLGDLAPAFAKDRPWLLEEYPAHDGGVQVTSYLDLAARLGASGALLWNLEAGVDDQAPSGAQRNEVLEALGGWRP